jgi:uncharacterized membrane-anchored protein
MAYSAKKRWMMTGSALTLGLAGMALVIWLARNHTDPVSVGLFRVTLALIVGGLAVRAYSYMDEVQRQTAQKTWFWGSLIGFAAMLPVVVFLQTHQLWLEAAVQFMPFLHPAGPHSYFSLGVVIPLMFQAVSALILRLLEKLPRGSQS